MRRWLAVAAGVLALVACGGDDPATEPDEPRELTTAEATRLSGVLAKNLDAEGAEFTINAKTDSGQLTMNGQIDFVEGYARATVSGDALPGLSEVAWTPNTLAELRTDIAELNPDAAGSVTWVGRPLDPGTNPDHLLALMFELTEEQRDNPLLVQQGEGAAYLRTDELRGTAVDVMSYDANTVYWVDDEGQMLRLEALGGGRQIVIDLLEHAPQEVQVPPQSEITPFDTVQDWYP